MDTERLPLLRKLEIFSTLTNKELEDLGPLVHLRNYAKNKLILDESDTNEYMYGVIEGEVKAFRVSEDGRETLLALRGEGKSFGELSMIDGKTAPATVSATEDSLVAVISREHFRQLLHSQEKINTKFMEILCAQLRDSLRMQEMMNQKNASERIRMLLSTLAEERGSKTDEGVVIGLKLTHQRIADMTGLTRESVTRALDRWRKSDHISINSSRQIVLKGKFFEGHELL